MTNLVLLERKKWSSRATLECHHYENQNPTANPMSAKTKARICQEKVKTKHTTSVRRSTN